jgi:acyl-CoA synthetase (AMP-forming)/AMP-acid ligase II
MHIDNNVFSFLEHHAENNPASIALRWVKPETLRNWSFSLDDPLPHESVGVGELTERICRVAAGYLELGIRKGDRVILFIPISVELYTAMFAIQRIGAIPVFLDSWARQRHLAITGLAVGPRAMVNVEKAYQLCRDIPELASIPIRVSVGPTSDKYTASLEALQETPSMAPIAPVKQEDTALITFTTGSSGSPKGANRTHRFLAAQHYALDKCIPYTLTDVDLPVFPIFSLNNIAAGVSTVIPAIDIGVPRENDPLILLAQISACNLTCVTLSPSIFNGLSAYCLKQKLLMPTLRRVITGGAPISRDNLIDFTSVARNAEVRVLYGSTEVEPVAHIEAREMIAFGSRSSRDSEWVDEGVNVGRIVEGLRYKFLKINHGPIEVQSAEDWNSLEIGPGEVGELIVAGEHVCRDYYNNPEALARSKILDENGEVWHRTGDLARMDEEGYLWIVGRVHNAIQRSGIYVFPVRAEIILKKLPFVQSAAYVGIPDPKLTERAVCVVVPKTTKHASSAQWEAEIKHIMAKNGVAVDQILFRDSIPMDPRHHSKVEYDVLRKQLQDASLSGETSGH